jgi:outer membrane protein assembly factor BamD
MPARNSMAQFNRLIDQYPASQYAQKANDHIQKGMENLSGHELYVADFYFKTKQYAAALKRYEYLVEHYPNSKESKKALNKIMECGALIKGN